MVNERREGTKRDLGARRFNYSKAFDRWDDVSTLKRFAPDTPSVTDLTAGQLRCIVHGWAFRYALLPDGRRFVRNFILPGDLIGCPFDRWPRGFPDVVAATDLECLDFDEAEAIRDPAQKAKLEQQVQRALVKEMGLLNAIALRAGRMTIYERTVHLFVELLERHRQNDLVSGDSFWLPIPQDVLADALGVSKVHLNRTLQQLRADRLIRLESSMLELLDVPRMMELVDYRYLFLDSRLA